MTGFKLLCVYGSLRQGLGNHLYLDNENVSYLGNFTSEPEWTMYSLGAFPAIVPDGEHGIVMEVYAVPEDVYEAIEYLEGYPSFYDRKSITTPYGEAEVYYIPEDRASAYTSGDIVPDGDWKSYRNETYSHRNYF